MSEKEWVDSLWQKVEHKLEQVARRSRDKIPYTTINGVHDDLSGPRVNWWTNGFWGGLMWLMYADTKKEIYKDVAQNQESLLDGALANYEALHHDVGFMWHITSGVHYRLLGEQSAKTRALYAANVLAGRYNLRGQYITAWNGNQPGLAIIDSMMNIPLLYWASKVTNDPRFRYIAESHADSTITNHVRADGSVRHIVVYDHEQGGVLKEIGGQGYSEGSSWSRGQAWGLYGFTLSYLHTGKEAYLDTAKRIAHYFLANTAADPLPLCDFRAPQEPVIYDSTAGAIAACGLLELAKLVPEYEQRLYREGAMRLMKELEQRCCHWEETEDAILHMGTERYGTGHHMPIIYGDYYFVEALYKLRDNTELFW
ncbi:MAG: glycoside hydrolase family 88 protein [Cellulosilyticaceae bacterium]